MNKCLISNIKRNFSKYNYFSYNFRSSFSKSAFKNFSSLIIPQIITTGKSQKLHQSVMNLSTVANQLDEDVHLILYSSDEISQSLLEEAKKIKNISKIYYYSNSTINLNDVSAEHLSTLIATLHNKVNKYDYILAASNNFGKNFLPRLGGLLDVAPISDVCKVEGKNTFSRYFYAGNAISKVTSEQKPNILTIRLTSFEKSVDANKNSVSIEDLSNNSEITENLKSVRSSKFVENMTTKSDKTELTQAKVVVSGGRALKSAENFKLVEDLAAQFENAAIGASRAAVDAGYVANDLQVGQTGKTVAPELYFAIGISGAIQHVAGMKDSKCIVAINTDADSPIFNYASYGLVGDLFKVLPELTEKIKLAKQK
jgi:electron transfer flavoprotein alpha subunit